MKKTDDEFAEREADSAAIRKGAAPRGRKANLRKYQIELDDKAWKSPPVYRCPICCVKTGDAHLAGCTNPDA